MSEIEPLPTWHAGAAPAVTIGVARVEGPTIITAPVTTYRPLPVEVQNPGVTLDELTGAVLRVRTENPLAQGLTNTELRAAPVPVSGAFYPATQPVSGPITDAQMRAAPVRVREAAADVVYSAALDLPLAGATLGSLLTAAVTAGATHVVAYASALALTPTLVLGGVTVTLPGVAINGPVLSPQGTRLMSVAEAGLITLRGTVATKVLVIGYRT